MIYVDPYDLRAPPEQVFGRKGARLARLFELIRHQNLAHTLAPHQPNPPEVSAKSADDFLRAAHTSLATT
ncbi:MAG: hypothetical protein Q9M48_08850 [Rhodobacterales bacterium]|nr:hypothetical protein [Rhodobacterales bacterium]